MIPISLILDYLKRGWEIIVISTLLVGLAVSAMTAYQAPAFRATASYIVSPNREGESPDFGDSLYGIDSLSRMTTANTYSEIMMSERIFTLAADNLDLSISERALYEREAVVLPETSVIRVMVTGPDPAVAAELANQIGTDAVSFIHSIYEVYILTGLDIATPTTEPLGLTPLVAGLLASAAGLALGLLLALIRTPELIGMTWSDDVPVGSPRPAVAASRKEPRSPAASLSSAPTKLGMEAEHRS